MRSRESDPSGIHVMRAKCYVWSTVLTYLSLNSMLNYGTMLGVALTMCMCVFSRDTVATLEEAVRVSKKAVGRCPDMEPLLVTARDRLQLILQDPKLAHPTLLCMRV